MACLKMSCSWPFASRTTEYLARERNGRADVSTIRRSELLFKQRSEFPASLKLTRTSTEAQTSMDSMQGVPFTASAVPFFQPGYAALLGGRPSLVFRCL